jgi:hypothetical protein
VKTKIHEILFCAVSMSELITRAVRKVKNVAHTTRAVVSLYQISHLVCSVECR